MPRDERSKRMRDKYQNAILRMLYECEYRMEFRDVKDMLEVNGYQRLRNTFISNILIYFTDEGYLDYQHEDGKHKSWLITKKGRKYLQRVMLDML